MATSISTLMYKVVADTKGLTQGMTATRKELAAAKKIMQETATPTQKLMGAMAGLDNLYKKNLITTKQYFAGIKRINDEAMVASGGLTKLGTSVKKVTTDQKAQHTLGGKLTKSMGGMVGSLATMAGGYLSVHSVIRAVNSDLQSQIDLNNKINSTQQTAATAQVGMLQMLGGVSTAEAGAFVSRMDAIASTTSMPRKNIYSAAGNVLSATGGNQSLTANVLDSSAGLFVSKPEGLEDFAGAVADLSTMVGVTDRNGTDAVSNLLMSGMQQMRITDLGKLKEASQAIAGVMTADTSGEPIKAAESGLRVFAAFGGAGKEGEGAITKTSLSNFATVLEQYLPEEDMLIGKGKKRRTVKGTGLQTMEERIAYIQEMSRTDKGMGADVRGMSFGKSTMNAIAKQFLLDPSSEVASRYAATEGVISAEGGLVGQIKKNTAGATAELAMQKAIQDAAASIETSEIGDIGSGVKATARSIMNDALYRTRVAPMGLQSFSDFQHSLGFDLSGTTGTQSIGVAISKLEDRREKLTTELVGSAFGPTKRKTKDLTDEERRKETILKDAIKVLVTLSEDISVIKNRGEVPEIVQEVNLP